MKRLDSNTNSVFNLWYHPTYNSPQHYKSFETPLHDQDTSDIMEQASNREYSVEAEHACSEAVACRYQIIKLKPYVGSPPILFDQMVFNNLCAWYCFFLYQKIEVSSAFFCLEQCTNFYMCAMSSNTIMSDKILSSNI